MSDLRSMQECLKDLRTWADVVLRIFSLERRMKGLEQEKREWLRRQRWRNYTDQDAASVLGRTVRVIRRYRMELKFGKGKLLTLGQLDEMGDLKRRKSHRVVGQKKR